MRRNPTQTTTARPTAIAAVIGLAALTAGCALLAGAHAVGGAAHDHGLDLGVLVAVTIGLQALSLTGVASSIGVSGLGMLVVGFTFGTGPGMATAVLAAGVHAARKRPKLHKALFNAACFTLATGAAVGAYRGLGGPDAAGAGRILLALLASCAFLVVNVGLLTTAMAVTEQLPPLRTWNDRLRWISPAYLAFGPLALVATVSYAHVGLGGVAVLAGSAGLLLAVLRRGLHRMRAAT
jgi:hypothetical protein